MINPKAEEIASRISNELNGNVLITSNMYVITFSMMFSGLGPIMYSNQELNETPADEIVNEILEAWSK